MASRIPALLENAEAAAEFVSAQIYRQHPEYLERYGEKGRKACRDDIASHLSYIDGALAAASALPFAEYLRWLRAVLRARGIDDESLPASLRLLGDFFEGRLDAQEKVLLQQILAAGMAALAYAHPDAAEPAWQRWLPSPLPAAERLTDHLTQGDLAAVRGIVHETQRAGGDYMKLATHLFQPSLYRVGELWQQNRASVAQEHLATAIVQNQLAQLYAAAEFGPANGRRALFACVEGNHHALGLRMVCDAFELAGWTVQYLGASLPLAALIAQATALQPCLIGLSASLAQQTTTLRTSILALRAEFERRRLACPEIIVGGLATNQIESLWRSLEADHWAPSADSRYAGELARRLPS